MHVSGTSVSSVHVYTGHVKVSVPLLSNHSVSYYIQIIFLKLNVLSPLNRWSVGVALEEERDDVEKKVGEALDENFDVLEEKRLKKAGMGCNYILHVFVCPIARV